MKYRISTLLLTVATLCICLGWLVDRTSYNRRTEALLDGAAVCDAASRSQMMANALKNWPDSVPGIVEAGLIKDVLDLYENSKSVDSFTEYLGSTNTASLMAKDTLESLECRTADDYFAMFRTRYNGHVYEEYKESTSAEHLRFRAFISSSITNQRIKSDDIRDIIKRHPKMRNR